MLIETGRETPVYCSLVCELRPDRGESTYRPVLAGAVLMGGMDPQRIRRMIECYANRVHDLVDVEAIRLATVPRMTKVVAVLTWTADLPMLRESYARMGAPIHDGGLRHGEWRRHEALAWARSLLRSSGPAIVDAVTGREEASASPMRTLRSLLTTRRCAYEIDLTPREMTMPDTAGGNELRIERNDMMDRLRTRASHGRLPSGLLEQAVELLTYGAQLCLDDDALEELVDLAMVTLSAMRGSAVRAGLVTRRETCMTEIRHDANLSLPTENRTKGLYRDPLQLAYLRARDDCRRSFGRAHAEIVIQIERACLLCLVRVNGDDFEIVGSTGFDDDGDGYRRARPTPTPIMA